jgi:uncharacterized protein YndB with AHSA1/START domain
MPVKKDPSGRRSVEAEAEVPGTPEEVWHAIATGPGISSWFVPTKVEEREGGVIAASFGPNMDSTSKITAWEPPRRFAADSRDDPGPDAPTVATEWIVEARSGGTCVVRVVHSWFASTDDWDDQYDRTRYGWIEFFRLLRVYLSHFRGQHGTCIQFMPSLAEPKSTAWQTLLGELGIESFAPGARVAARQGAPKLAGLVERVGEGDHPEMLLLRIDEPAPGFAHLFALPMAGRVFLPIRLYLFGERAPAIARREETVWQTFLDKQLSKDPA